MADLNVKLILQAIDRISAPVRNVSGAVGRAMSNVRQSVDRASKSMEGLQRASERVGQAGRRLRNNVTLPLAIAGGAAVKFGADFEESLSHIVGLVGIAQEQVNAWREDLLRLGPALGKTPNELAEAMFFITSAQLRGQTAMDALLASAKASAAGLGETKVVANIVTSALRAYGTENLNAADATGILVATVREGKTEADSIASALGRVLPLAAQLDVTFDQVGAAVAAMTGPGFDAAEATTALRGILAKLLAPSDNGHKALRQFGLSAGQVKKQLREEGLLATLQMLNERFGGNEQALKALFEDVEALTGVLNLLGKSAEDNEKIFKALAEAGSQDLDKAFTAIEGNVNQRLRKSLSALQVLLIRVSDAMKPFVAAILDRFVAGVTALAEGFRALPAPVKNTILLLAAIAAAAGPVLIGLGTLGLAIKAMVIGFVALKAALVAFGGVIPAVIAGIRALTLAIAANPIGALITALVVGATLIIANWETVKKWFADFVAFMEGLIPDWLKRLFGLQGGVAAPRIQAPQLGAPRPTVGAAGERATVQQLAQVGGSLRIQIDSEGRPRVREVRTDNPRVPIDVDAGLVMAGN